MNIILMLSAHYPLTLLTQIYDYTRSRLYRHQAKKHRVDPERQVLLGQATALFEQSRESIGSRTMSTMLKQRGHAAGRYKARSLVREAGLDCQQPGKKHRYCHHEPCSHIVPNRLKRNFNPEKANQYWCGDVTYIHTQQGWCYAAVVQELHSRKIIGWAVSENPNSELTLAALDMAVQSRGRPQDVTFHSDQGCHYTSKSFTDALARNGVTQSMSRRGNCWDNAVCERLFRSFKTVCAAQLLRCALLTRSPIYLICLHLLRRVPTKNAIAFYRGRPLLRLVLELAQLINQRLLR